MAKQIITTTPDQPMEPSVRFDPSRFEKLISDKGYEAYIDEALKCPCADRQTGQALPTCKNCLGLGWFFANRKQTRLVSQGMNFQKHEEQWTEMNKGTARITTRGVDRLAFMDKITLIDLEGYFSEVLRPTREADILRAFPVYTPLEVLSMYQFKTSDQPLIPFTSADYTIVNNYIKFADKYKKVDDFSVSIRYVHNPVYHVIDMNRELMKVRVKSCTVPEDQLKQMPVSALARKAHYIWDNVNQLQNNIFDNSVIIP